MSMADDNVTREALGWLIRINEADFRDWERFEKWLDQDPEHSARYWRLARAEDAAAADLALARTAAARRPPRRSLRWPVAGMGVAAIAASIIVFALVPRGDRIFETAPGTSRNVTLADGTSIDLNGDSRVTIGRSGRVASLDRGEAMFSVVHDAAHPFTVNVGGTLFRDVGTAFDIARDPDGTTRIAVAAGAVMVDPGGAAKTIVAGQTASRSGDGTTLSVGDIERDAVGAWRQGRLVYDGATIEQMIGDIARAGGGRVTVEPSVSARQVSGSLAIKDRTTLAPRAAMLLGLEAERQPDGWRFRDRESFGR